MKPDLSILFLLMLVLGACKQPPVTQVNVALQPSFTTDTSLNDTDDPAIWINTADPLQSLILGTDKGDINGGIYAFDVRGKLVNKITPLPRPNNIDIEYGFILGGDTIDIAVFTQRNGANIRILRLPDLAFIDGGGIDVFVGDTLTDPMGIGLYKKPDTHDIYAVVGRKFGPDGVYLWQYHLTDSAGTVIGKVVRKFGAFKGGKEIEAICVDDAMGYIYYADEGAGIHKYYADPNSSKAELAFFGNSGFTEDHEGISIYPTGSKTGYLLVSDQQANRFHVYTREGTAEDPHLHKLITYIPVSTNESDGSDVTSHPIGTLYPKGFFVAMSDNKTFQIYNWEKLDSVIQQKMVSTQ